MKGMKAFNNNILAHAYTRKGKTQKKVILPEKAKNGVWFAQKGR